MKIWYYNITINIIWTVFSVSTGIWAVSGTFLGILEQRCLIHLKIFMRKRVHSTFCFSNYLRAESYLGF